MNVLLMAKTPVPGRVKTRLCPPCTPAQAAAVAAAALADTVDAVNAALADTVDVVNAALADTVDVVNAAPVRRRVLVVDGDLAAPAGWDRIGQRGADLGARLANAFADAHGGLLIGMDTPQVSASQLRRAMATLDRADAALGLAEDGGWWALGLRDPAHAEVLRDIATSTPTTGAETLDALRRRGLRVSTLPSLRDVDTAEDAHAVAALCGRTSRFATAVAAHVPAPAAQPTPAPAPAPAPAAQPTPAPAPAVRPTPAPVGVTA